MPKVHSIVRMLAVFSFVSFAVAVAPGASPSLAASPPTFGQPTISGIAGVGFEQDIRLDPTNARRAYTSVPGALSSDTSWIWRSLDGGKTFKWVPSSTPLDGKPNACAGGGDTELAVDSAGNLYFNDLTLANFSTARSPDQGTSFTCSNTGVPDTAVDRQWYAVDGNPATGDGTGNGAGHNIFLVNDEIGPGGVVCPDPFFVPPNNVLAMYRSPTLDGGTGTGGIEFGPPNKVTTPGSCDEGIMGNDEVSPVATTTGKIVAGAPTTLSTPVKHVYVVHDDADLHRILIGRCFPVAFGPPVPNVSDPSGLNCDDLPVADLGTGVRTGGNFPTLAIDTAGNLYAVWEQAPVDNDANSPTFHAVTGDTVLEFAYSTDEGNTWSDPVTIPTPGLHNNVFAWTAAGTDGRVDIAFYGTPGVANPDDPTCGVNNGGFGGPDATTDALWSLYMVQTLDGHASASAVPTFTAPILAGEHYTHKGSIQTLIGGQCGDRTLGDFLQMRVGAQGEAQIAYADSNNRVETSAPHGMYVRQNGGTGVIAGVAVGGDAILDGSATDPDGDGRYEASGSVSSNIANLDILASSMTSIPTGPTCPSPPPGFPSGCYHVTMTMKNLSLTLPPAPDSDTDLVWLTQWLVPASPTCTAPPGATDTTCSRGGKNFFVYAEWNPSQGSAVNCFDGDNARQRVGGGVAITYPGAQQITTPGACNVTPGLSGTIAIDVPISDVTLSGGSPRVPIPALDGTLYSVTASTMTEQGPANTPPPAVSFTGGQLFNLIDAVRAYDFNASPSADLSISKTDSPDPVHLGQKLTYTIVVANAGPSAASGVTVRDQLPKNTGFGSVSTTKGTCGPKPHKRVVTCNIGGLASGANATVTILVKPTAKGTITNTATVTSSSPPDPIATNNTATATTTVQP